LNKNEIDSGFFITIGWPAGRGEYDNLFANLHYFCEKINQWDYLFNFSSFIFGFSIPKKDFVPHYEKTYKQISFREVLNEKFAVSKLVTDGIRVLLDVGGPRIFNKIVLDKLPLTDKESYRKYLSAYNDFISINSPEIYVNFDIGPAYSSRNDVSITGRNTWFDLPQEQRETLNLELLEDAIEHKTPNSKLMVPVNGSDLDSFTNTLDMLYNNFRQDVDIVGIAGIANQGLRTIMKTLERFNHFKVDNDWSVHSHGLGLGGWKKIPYLVHFNIDSCDVATPWRRACTDRDSNYYIPLLDANLNFTNYGDAMKLFGLYNEKLNDVVCNCPFCQDLPLSELLKRFSVADKRNSGTKQHAPDYREMRIRAFFHNVYQHIAIFRKMKQYKIKFGESYLSEFLSEISNKSTKQKISKVFEPLLE